MKKDYVSIIIPCYNGEKYLRDCLDSLLKQTYQKLEIIVINDGSTDNTLNILKEYENEFKKHNMMYHIINKNNEGQASAVNDGLKVVSGEFLCWQDCDDIYENNAIEKMYNFLNSNSDFDMVRGNVNYVDEEMKTILKTAMSNYPNLTNIFDLYVFEKDSYCFAGIFMIRMSKLDKCISHRNINTSRAGQNWQLILPVAYCSKCGYINEIVYNYRQVPTSHSHKDEVTKINVIKKKLSHQSLLIKIVLNIKQMPIIKKLIYILRIILKYIWGIIDVLFKKQKEFIKKILRRGK